MRRRGDQDLAGAGLEVLGRLVAGGKDARAFHDDVDLEVAPWKMGRMPFLEHSDTLSVDFERGPARRNLTRVDAVNRVVLEEVSVGLGGAQIVDGNELQVIASRFHRGTKDKATDTAKPIDGNANRHTCLQGR